MKKYVVLVLTVIFMFCMLNVFVSTEASDNYTVADALSVLRAVVNDDSSHDVNFDGKTNFFDVLFIIRTMIENGVNWTLEMKNTTTVSVSGSKWWDLGVQYPRLIILENSSKGQNGYLLATFEELNSGLVSGKPGYPIYRSTDNGQTWEKLTVVRDNSTQVQSEWNPHLLELSKPLGNYPAGTVLLAGCSVDAAHSKASAIRLYVSTNGGESFSYPISIAEGGGLDNGVWEPFLLQLDDGRLVCYYSDDGDDSHSQKIVYRVSSDGVNFSEAVEVVASDIKAERPGMPVVTRLGDGTYFMVYEVVDHKSISGNPVFYRTSPDGLDWGDVSKLGTALESKSGKALGSAPYCTWTPLGGKNGTLIVSGTFMRRGTSSTGTDYFISTDSGKTFNTVSHLIPYDATVDHCGYSNCVVALGKYLYAINNPIDENNAGHSKIVFARAMWKIED